MNTLSDYDFALPCELIAQTPLSARCRARLLELCADANDSYRHRRFTDLVDCLHPGDVLVFNNTRVLKARFRGIKPTGGKVEVLIERVIDCHTAIAHIRASKPPARGSVLLLAQMLMVTVGQRTGENGALYTLIFPQDVFQCMQQYGYLPLPPYIQRDPMAIDETYYQTIYAKIPGAVAAPTAGLHFDDRLIAQCRAKGVHCVELTLHVGAGTFIPVRVEDLSLHTMHSEWYTIPVETVNVICHAKASGRDIIAVGTTSLRALESASQSGILRAQTGETRLFIRPGYQFQTVTRLITNFHLPQSSLLMLVSAFAGYQRIRAAYAYAIGQRYRFFSYGDAMLLSR